MSLSFQITLIAIAAIAGVTAILLGCAFVSAKPESTGNGVIVGYTFAAAETEEHTFPSNFRNIETMPRTLRRNYPNRHIYEIKVDGLDNHVRYVAPAVEGLKKLEIGQQVRVTYIERSIPLLWRKIYVNSVDLMDSK